MFDVDVKGVTFHELPKFDDLRGSLIVGEVPRDLPFPITRYFIVSGVSDQEIRGKHAHRECHQFLVCIKGSITLVVDDGVNRQEFTLDRPDLGVHMKPMVWGEQYKFSADAIQLVLASDPYDPDDYISDYQQFLELKHL